MKNKTTLVFFLIAIIFAIKCTSNNSNVSSSPTNVAYSSFEDTQKIRNYTQKLILGDTIAYLELRAIYFDSGNGRHFLRNAIIMSDDFNFGPAYYDVYTILKTDIVDSANVRSNNLANYYLLKAYEADVKDSKFSIKERFGKSAKLPNSHSYWISLNKNNN